VNLRPIAFFGLMLNEFGLDFTLFSDIFKIQLVEDKYEKEKAEKKGY